MTLNRCLFPLALAIALTIGCDSPKEAKPSLSSPDAKERLKAINALETQYGAKPAAPPEKGEGE